MRATSIFAVVLVGLILIGTAASVLVMAAKRAVDRIEQRNQTIHEVLNQ